MGYLGLRVAVILGAALITAGCTSGTVAPVIPTAATSAIPASAISEEPAVATGTTTPMRPVSAAGLPTTSRGTDAVLVVRDLFTGGTCAYGVLVPRLVVYADGRVIRRGQSTGMYCDPVPTFTTGQTNVTAIRPVMENYLNSAPAKVDMTHPPGIADASGTSLDYTRSDETRTVIAAVAVRERGMLPRSERPPRDALASVLDRLDALTPTGKVWLPATVTITKPPAWPYDPTPRGWPLTVTPALRQLVAGPGNHCIAVSGRPARDLLAAARNRPAGSTWTIDGRPAHLAIGVVAAGFPPCR